MMSRVLIFILLLSLTGCYQTNINTAYYTLSFDSRNCFIEKQTEISVSIQCVREGK